MTWKILQWPLAFLLVSTAVGLVYYFAPDAEQDWVWITPGAILGTMLWVIVSLASRSTSRTLPITMPRTGQSEV
jgi:membrane protein